MQLPENDTDTRIELKKLSAEEEKHLQEELREKAWRDSVDRYEGAFEKGRRLGIQEIVKDMYKDGIVPEKIAKYLRLDLSDVKGSLNIQ